MTDSPDAVAQPDEPANRAGARGISGWSHNVRNLGSSKPQQGASDPADQFFGDPTPRSRPEPSQPDSEPNSAAQDKSDSSESNEDTVTTAQAERDKKLGDDDEAYARSEIRDVLADALRTFGLRKTGVYVSTSGPVQFHGPVSGGDMAFTAGAAAMVSEKVSATMLEEIDRYFVWPGGYAQAAEALAKTNMLFLRVRRRWGGTTAALRLLADAKSVYQLRMESALSGLRPEDIPMNSGVLVDGISAVQASSLRQHDLRTKAEFLIERKSRLIVVLDWDVRIDAEVLRDTVTLQSPPDARSVVARHLAHVLPEHDGTDLLLSSPEVARLLEGINEASFDVQQLAEMARDIAEMANGRIGSEDVEQRFTLRAQQSLRSWLDDLTEPQFALVVSLAALHGMSYDAVATAAKRLEDALVGEYADRLVKRSLEPRHKRLTAARAVVTTTARRSRYGVSEMEVASFADISHPAAVMRYVWHEYDTHRNLLITWLRESARAPEQSVRIRAASTLGYLACFSFDELRREVIVPWAGSGNADERELAVAALAVPARHPNTRGSVINLVKDWLDRTGDGPLRRTAARALGLAVGEIIPGGPEEQLDRLAEKAAASLSVALGDSIAELMLNGDPDRIRNLLKMLRRWADDVAGRRRIAGAFAFLEVASTLWVARKDDTGEETWWPTLLALTDQHADPQDEIHRNIVDLWSLSLLAPRTDVFVHRVLRRWAKAAEAEPNMQEAFVHLFTEVANRRPRLAGLLRYHAKTWRGKVPDAPAIAAKLLDILRVKGA